jgi:anti-sigma factor ChrR (cupin superfamily)
MNPILSCADVTRFATDHLEGRLALPLNLRMRAHLGICRTCRAFVDSLKALPGLVGSLVQEPDPASAPDAFQTQQQAALAGALARLALNTPRSPVPPAHPLPEAARTAAARPGADLTLRLMVQAYEAIQAGGPATEAPYLPGGLGREVAEPATWSWNHALLQGCRTTELAQDPRTGSRLYLMVLPPGRRFPDHVHRGGEDFLVLHGYAEDEAHYLGPGDWLRRSEATQHRDVEGRQEVCWGLARVEKEGIRLLGWRGLLQRAYEILAG